MTGCWFSPGTPGNKTDRHDIVESGVKHHKPNQTNPIFKIKDHYSDNIQIQQLFYGWVRIKYRKTTDKCQSPSLCDSVIVDSYKT